MENKLISIIVPVYNTKEYLKKCVDSLCGQTYRNLEIILVNDGSTDESGKLCEELAGADARIRVYHKENGGSSSARNFGIAVARGEYLGFVDSDDYVDADMYQRLYEALERTGARIAQVGRNEITPEGEILPDICIPPEKEEFISSGDFMKELLMHRGDCSYCTKLLDRRLFFEGDPEQAGDDNSFPVGVLNEDFHLLIQMLGKCDGVVSLPGHSYHVFYRLGSNSRKKSKNEFSRAFADNIDNADFVAEIVKEHYPAYEDIAFRFGIFQRIDYMLHIPIAQMQRDNSFYRKTVSYLRKNWGRSMRNTVLTKKNKVYHTLFALAPRTVRVVHAKIKGIK